TRMYSHSDTMLNFAARGEKMIADSKRQIHGINIICTAVAVVSVFNLLTALFGGFLWVVTDRSYRISGFRYSTLALLKKEECPSVFWINFFYYLVLLAGAVSLPLA